MHIVLQIYALDSLQEQRKLYFLDRLKILPSRFVDGTIAIRANHGVAQTLNTNLKGSIAFVIAYAVASLCHYQLLPRVLHWKNSLNNYSCATFTSAPPRMPPSSLLPQPSLLPEILAKLFHSICHPLALPQERRHPLRVMESRCQAQQRHHCCQFM